MPDMLDELLAEDEPAGIGHNQPGADDLARERVDALVANANRWAAQRPEITDAEMAARCSDFLDQLTAEVKKLDQQRKDEKAPHLAAAAAVDIRWNPLLRLVSACKELLQPKLQSWLRREQQRVEAERRRREEEARRLAAEADAAVKRAAEAKRVEDITLAQNLNEAAREAADRAAAAPTHAQSRGNLGGRARSLRTQWKAAVVDLDKTFRHYRGRAEVKELLERLANADARSGVRAIPGCQVYEERV